ncbi:MAG: YqjD family protein [Pirellulales bacterium]
MRNNHFDAGGQPGDELRDTVQQLRQGLTELGRLLGQTARQKMEEFRAAAAEQTAAARQPASAYSPDPAARPRETAEPTFSADTALRRLDQITEFVRTRPVQSVLAAGGVGLLLGMTLCRR